MLEVPSCWYINLRTDNNVRCFDSPRAAASTLRGVTRQHSSYLLSYSLFYLSPPIHVLTGVNMRTQPIKTNEYFLIMHCDKVNKGRKGLPRPARGRFGLFGFSSFRSIRVLPPCTAQCRTVQYLVLCSYFYRFSFFIFHFSFILRVHTSTARERVPHQRSSRRPLKSTE